MVVLCVECRAPVELGEYHQVLPTRPTDLQPRRVHLACHELAHHIASSYRSGRALAPGELKSEWARVREQKEKVRPEPFAAAKVRAQVIASRLLAFKGPRAASEWT